MSPRNYQDSEFALSLKARSSIEIYVMTATAVVGRDKKWRLVTWLKILQRRIVEFDGCRGGEILSGLFNIIVRK